MSSKTLVEVHPQVYAAAPVRRSILLRGKKSPFLIGDLQEGGSIKDARQVSRKDLQMSIFDML